MWWKKKKTNNEQLIKRIIKESVVKTGVTADIIATRLSKEAGVELEAAKDIAKTVLVEFLRISYEKIIKIIKEKYPEFFTLPFSESNIKIVKREIDKLANNQIELEQLVDAIFEIQLVESDDWLKKGAESKMLGKFDEALKSFDISLKFDTYNQETLLERGQLLQNLNFHKAAIKDFSKIIEYDENDFNIFYLRGCSYMKLCDFENAFADISRAIELSNLANDRQKQFATDNGYDSIASMYKTSLDLLETLKDSPTQVISGIIEKNGKERTI